LKFCTGAYSRDAEIVIKGVKYATKRLMEAIGLTIEVESDGFEMVQRPCDADRD
jgi:hypothetical protein